MTRLYFSALQHKRIDSGPHMLEVSPQNPGSGKPSESRPRAVSRARKAADPEVQIWTVGQKARVLTDAAVLTGESLRADLMQQGVSLMEYERWCLALQEGPRVPVTTILQRRRRIRPRTSQRPECTAMLCSGEPNYSAAPGRVQRHSAAHAMTAPGSDEDDHQPADTRSRTSMPWCENAGAVEARSDGPGSSIR